MQRENQKPTQQDVLPAVAKFLSFLWMEGEFREQPEYLSEIFEAILETEIGDNQHLRTKMISCMKTIKMLTQALDPFSDQQIAQACSEIATA
ncbi:hypothetical protein [Flavobacterium tructae]|uniref:Uncharacterized protein n=1 Tax=Flavobacterium tructae TaxID=1114873 RepID=A0A1S1JA76_9FLAO|nr:hypothetical protein [Flavobacterium tructae]OHT46638.1 hypothetical protein BHE19_03780 [Flavobacterium tructae]OXB20949.1 hypothetical protein B0A71_04955 [Flavobacterium tructae]